jgi:hypothetical protein
MSDLVIAASEKISNATAISASTQIKPIVLMARTQRVHCGKTRPAAYTNE